MQEEQNHMLTEDGDSNTKHMARTAVSLTRGPAEAGAGPRRCLSVMQTILGLIIFFWGNRKAETLVVRAVS